MGFISDLIAIRDDYSFNFYFREKKNIFSCSSKKTKHTVL